MSADVKDVRFYHLLHRGVADVVPELVMKGLERGEHIIVRTQDAQMREYLDEHLWTFKADSFVPHGAGKDAHGARQPVWITEGDDNPNNATILMLAGAGAVGAIDDYKLCCVIFDGRDDGQVKAARAQWKLWQADAGIALTYWQQNEKGGWDKKS